jgi:hypothetical protein
MARANLDLCVVLAEGFAQTTKEDTGIRCPLAVVDNQRNRLNQKIGVEERTRTFTVLLSPAPQTGRFAVLM